MKKNENLDGVIFYDPVINLIRGFKNWGENEALRKTLSIFQKEGHHLMFLKKRFDESIVALLKIFYEIVIDFPPIHLVTDALIIARVADVSLHVVTRAYTHKYELEFINEIVEAKRFPKFSIVFYGVKSGYAQNHGYVYGYGGYKTSYNSYAVKKRTLLKID